LDVSDETYEVMAARGARTQSLFRAVNERVREINEGFSEVLTLGDWVCECADDACVERVSVSPAEYEAIRSDPRRFLVFPDQAHVFDQMENVVH
jgi:hypothetical protein